MELKCGFSKVDITPKLGIALSGYAYERYAEGINDQLYARIIYLKKGNCQLCLIGTDLIAVDKYLCHEISAKTGVDTFCWATHTHSGPGGFFNPKSEVLSTLKSIFGEYNLDYYDLLTSRIISGINEAKGNLDDAVIRVNRSMVENIGKNRHTLDGFFNPELLILEIKKINGKRAILYNYACHPTVLNKFNMLVSADFPGYVANSIEKQTDIELCMFLNGAAGDISTRFTRKESSFNDVMRLGTIIKDEILKQINSGAKYENVTRFNYIEKDLELPVREFPTLIEAEKEYHYKLRALEENTDNTQARILQSEVEGALVNLLYAKEFPNTKRLKTRMSGLVINNHFLIGIPGELYNILGNDIKSSLTNNVFLGTYFQDYVGYIVPKTEYEKRTYESFSTLFVEGTGEFIVTEAIQLLNKLKGDI